jgi:hypothetical protein
MTMTSAMAQQNEYKVEDRYFRYESILGDTTNLFSNINIHKQFYPCVDELEVKESSLVQGDFELVSQTGYTEFYAYKDSVLSLIGRKAIDPFLSIPNMTIQFFIPIPLIRKIKTKQFRHQGNSEFFLAYKSKYLPQNLKKWTTEQGITEIRITGVVDWDNKFVRNDFYKDIFMTEMMGNVIAHDINYKVVKLEIKKGKWEKVDLEAKGFLQDLFSEKKEKYYSFYELKSVVEIARINSIPFNTFSIQLDRSIGDYPNCSHSKNDIYVFPNPTFDNVNIRIEGSEYKYYTLSIYNIIGKKLWSKRINVNSQKHEEFVDLPPLEKGVYIYGVDTPNGKRIKSRRLVIIDL